MSLINKMLADLESRVTDVKNQPAAKPVLAGLHSVKDDAGKKKLVRMALLSVLLVGSLAVGASRLWPLLIPLAPTLFATQTSGVPHEAREEPQVVVAGAISQGDVKVAVDDVLSGSLPDGTAEEAGMQAQIATPMEPPGDGELATNLDAVHADAIETHAVAAEQPVDAQPIASGPAFAESVIAPIVPPPSVVAMPPPLASQSVATPASDGSMSMGPEPDSAASASAPQLALVESSPLAAPAPAASPATPSHVFPPLEKPLAAVEKDPSTTKPARLPSMAAEPKAAPAPPAVTPASESVGEPMTIATSAAPAEHVAQGEPKMGSQGKADQPAPNQEPLVLASAESADHGRVAKAGSVMADRAYRSGVEYLNRGRMAEAEERLRAAIEGHPEHSEARLALAGSLMNQQRILEAQVVLEDGERVDGFNDGLAQALSRIYIELGQEDRALQLLEKHKPKGVDNPDFMATLAALYQRQGRFSEAAAAYRVALAKRPAEGRWWLGMGLALESTQQWSAASMAYAQAVNSSSLPSTLMTYAEKRLAEVRIKAK